MRTNWKLTDPTCNQYGRKTGEGRYEFKERRVIGLSPIKTEIFRAEIILSEYSEEKKAEAVVAFGYSSFEDLMKLYDHEAEWILAECIFELE